jgi:hypothetical protein
MVQSFAYRAWKFIFPFGTTLYSKTLIDNALPSTRLKQKNTLPHSLLLEL